MYLSLDLQFACWPNHDRLQTRHLSQWEVRGCQSYQVPGNREQPVSTEQEPALRLQFRNGMLSEICTTELSSLHFDNERILLLLS